MYAIIFEHDLQIIDVSQPIRLETHEAWAKLFCIFVFFKNSMLWSWLFLAIKVTKHMVTNLLQEAGEQQQRINEKGDLSNDEGRSRDKRNPRRIWVHTKGEAQQGQPSGQPDCKAPCCPGQQRGCPPHWTQDLAQWMDATYYRVRIPGASVWYPKDTGIPYWYRIPHQWAKSEELAPINPRPFLRTRPPNNL